MKLNAFCSSIARMMPHVSVWRHRFGTTTANCRGMASRHASWMPLNQLSLAPVRQERHRKVPPLQY